MPGEGGGVRSGFRLVCKADCKHSQAVGVVGLGYFFSYLKTETKSLSNVCLCAPDKLWTCLWNTKVNGE